MPHSFSYISFFSFTHIMMMIWKCNHFFTYVKSLNYTIFMKMFCFFVINIYFWSISWNKPQKAIFIISFKISIHTWQHKCMSVQTENTYMQTPHTHTYTKATTHMHAYPYIFLMYVCNVMPSECMYVRAYVHLCLYACVFMYVCECVFVDRYIHVTTLAHVRTDREYITHTHSYVH